MRNHLMTIILIAFVLTAPTTALSQDQGTIPLVPFTFDLTEDSSFLENEAGISAYGQLNYVDLDLAENAFKYVEKRTANYIIGAVSLPDYDEEHDVHVYVDTSKWIIAYYLAQEQPGKIIDWVDYYTSEAVTGTKLEAALNKVVGEMSAFLPQVKYYDFRYPNATNILIITDEEGTSTVTETFRFMVPAEYFLHSKTWSHATYRGRNSSSSKCTLLIDGNILHAGGGSEWVFNDGEIAGGLITYNTYHTVELFHVDNTSTAKSFGAIVLIYSSL